MDGDRLEVLHNQDPERIRLNGIACPEKRQAYGQRPQQAASELIFAKEVTSRPMAMTSTGARLLMCSCRAGSSMCMAAGASINCFNLIRSFGLTWITSIAIQCA